MDTLPFSQLSWVGLMYRAAKGNLKMLWYLVESVYSQHLITPWLEVLLLIVCLVCTTNQLHLYLYPITDGIVNLNKSAVCLGCLLCLHFFYYTDILDISLKKELKWCKSLDLEIAFRWSQILFFMQFSLLWEKLLRIWKSFCTKQLLCFWYTVRCYQWYFKSPRWQFFLCLL